MDTNPDYKLQIQIRAFAYNKKILHHRLEDFDETVQILTKLFRSSRRIPINTGSVPVLAIFLNNSLLS